MTDPDPFAAATVNAHQSAPSGGQGSNGGTDQLTGNNAGYDPLFGGEKLVSLFDKSIGIGEIREGIITKVPTDKQSRFYKANGVGALKFWAPQGSDSPVTDRPSNADGSQNRPCMDTVFVLQTSYQLPPGELAARQMDEDGGLRGFFAAGASLAATRTAIKAAGLSSREQLVGMKMSIIRTGKKPAGDYEAWTWAVKIEKV